MPEAVAPSSGRAGAYFPRSYLEGFLYHLADQPERYRIITYADLDFDGDRDEVAGFPREQKAWERRRAELTDDPDRTIFVLLQHDVDSRPERTHPVLELEAELGLPSNVMIFAERHDRKLLKRSGQLALTPYPVDHERLTQLVDLHGFIVGYHTNAVERAGWDLTAAVGVFAHDLDRLDDRYGIRFFSPHGGVPGPNGTNNNNFVLPNHLRQRVRWVHNRYTVRFDGNFSDGGINNPKRDIRQRDLRDFVESWRPGRRYRVLVHPQYYAEHVPPADHLLVADWYARLFESPSGGLDHWGRASSRRLGTELRT